MKQRYKKVLTLICVLILIFSPFYCIRFSHAAESTDILINRAEHKLYYRENGLTIRAFPITVGKNTTPTPNGRYSIIYKEEDRPFYKKRIAGGTPDNPLGSRWLGLNIKGTNGYTYGIHGTNQPKAIGLSISNGCIRMSNADVEWLYDTVKKGTTVIIE